MNLERCKTVSDIVAAWFGLLALVAGGAFAVVQYLEKDRADRVKNSIDLLARFNDTHVVEARSKILDIWRRREGELIAAAEKSTSDPGIYNGFVLDAMKAEGAYAAFSTMVDFFELVQICVVESVCDKSVANALFRPDAKVFFRLHYPVIEQIRTVRKDQSYARLLQSLAVSQ